MKSKFAKTLSLAISRKRNNADITDIDCVPEVHFDSETQSLVVDGTNCSNLPCLDAALYLANVSKDYGQAQGGSLYFNDLGVAILQFENPELRNFIPFKPPSNEPLMRISVDEIRQYYEEQTSD